MAVVDVVTEIVIDRDVADVAAFAVDPDNATRWYANIRRATWITAPPLVVGSRIAFVASFLGRELSYTYQVVEHVPAQRFVMTTSEGPFPMTTTYLFERTDGGTRMTLRNAGQSTGFAKAGAPLMERAMQRANGKDLQALKRLLEP